MPIFKDQGRTADNGDDAEGMTLIDRDVTLIGEIVSDENIRLRGRVEGNVLTSGSVVIEPQGSVRGDIRASVVAIAEESFLQGKVLATEKISTNVKKRRLERP